MPSATHLHAILIHFPIALLLIGFLAELIALVVPKPSIKQAAFAVNGGFRNTLRLNFSNVQPELISVAVERLAGVVREMRK